MKANVRTSLAGYGFILPWLIALVVFISYPFLAGFYFSFCEFPPLQGPLFIGLGNYAELVTDSVFHHSLGTTLIYAAVAIPLGVFLAFTLAMLLNTRIRGQNVYRVIFYLPHLVPTVVVAILWLWIFNPEFGLVNWVVGMILNVIDGWTNLFFDLDGVGAGSGSVSWRSLTLLPSAVVLLVLVVRGLLIPRGACRQLEARGLLKGIGAACGAVAAIAATNVLLHHLLPVDVERLHSPGWLSDGNPFPSGISFAPPWALWALIVMSMWGVGQMAIIYLAKLQDVPVELYEAADIDGATWLQKTWHVTVPMMSPVILFNVVMGIIGTFQVFTEPYIMTGGGPEDKTRFVAMFVYDNAFQYQRVGYASAVAWVLFLLIVGLTLLAFRVSRKHVYYAGR